MKLDIEASPPDFVWNLSKQFTLYCRVPAEWGLGQRPLRRRLQQHPQPFLLQETSQELTIHSDQVG